MSQPDVQFGYLDPADTPGFITETLADPDFHSLHLTRHPDGRLVAAVAGLDGQLAAHVSDG